MVKVGGDVVAYCTKCRMDLNHTIHAIVNNIPVKVECNTCGGIHKYHAAKETKDAAKAQRASSASTRSTSAEPSSKPSQPKASSKVPAPDPFEVWAELIKGKRDTGSKPYQINSSYTQGDVIDHPTFGLGIVEKRLAPQKISVIFRDGTMSLVDNR